VLIDRNNSGNKGNVYTHKIHTVEWPVEKTSNDAGAESSHRAQSREAPVRRGVWGGCAVRPLHLGGVGV